MLWPRTDESRTKNLCKQGKRCDSTIGCTKTTKTTNLHSWHDDNGLPGLTRFYKVCLWERYFWSGMYAAAEARFVNFWISYKCKESTFASARNRWNIWSLLHRYRATAMWNGPDKFKYSLSFDEVWLNGLNISPQNTTLSWDCRMFIGHICKTRSTAHFNSSAAANL